MDGELAEMGKGYVRDNWQGIIILEKYTKCSTLEVGQLRDEMNPGWEVYFQVDADVG
jgi:hypothetical protein